MVMRNLRSKPQLDPGNIATFLTLMSNSEKSTSLLNELKSPGAFRTLSPVILMMHYKPTFGTATNQQKPSPNLESSPSINSLICCGFVTNPQTNPVNFL